MRRFLTFVITAAVSIFTALTVSTAHAAFIEAELPTQSADASVGTHVVVAGQGLEAGTTWLIAAHTQALIYRDRLPRGSVRLITAVDPSQKEKYLELLRTWGYQNVNYFAKPFLGTDLVDRLAQVPLIASLDFIGHDGAFLGFALEDEGADHRFFKANVDQLAKRAHFSKDSFVRIMGCNTGWILAPYMSQVLGVPAAGTLTSADVEILSAQQIWYFDLDSTYPKGVAHAQVNDVSYSASQACTNSGGCVRLRPVNTSYHGQHGNYVGAVPFLKFFCGSADRSDCFRRMALSVRYLVGVKSMQGNSANELLPSKDEFIQTVADQMCPPNVNQTSRQACLTGVTQHLLGIAKLPLTFTTLGKQTPQIACEGFGKCKFQVGVDSQGRQILIGTVGAEPSNTFVNELNAYSYGYQLLQGIAKPQL